jgi:hypothetical protein
MFKKFIAVALLMALCLAVCVGMTGCGNMTVFDITYSFERATVDLHNGEVVEGVVEQWLDFEDSDMIQVKIDGKVYLTHSVNVVLISE